ncbi:hypothetical protein [Mesorhizobium sp. Cs1299R1N3]|uniref:hypothetical protein n=1 Tax=Mesorhizobium sp. Cs1299R1N3 TaxID=3015173 RepID=UPI00301BFCED
MAWTTPSAGRGPALTDKALTRRYAVDYAKTAAECDLDWQETQWNLLNRYPYAMLFDGMTEDEVDSETMAIIREGEDAVAV